MARVSTSDFWLMYSTLREDVDTYWQPIHDTENRTYLYPDPVVLSQPARRAVVRAVFAFAEASSFLLRQLLLSDFEERLEVEVVMALKELQISLANSGQVRKTTLRAGALPYIRLTFTAYSQLFPNANTPNCSGPAFEALAASVVVRDRLMHPKEAAALAVSDDEIRSLLQGFCWLNESMRVVLRVHVDELRRATLSTKGDVQEP